MADLASLNAALAAILSPTEAAPAPAKSGGGKSPGEGKRNTTLTSLAGSMRRAGLSVEAIAEALLKENAARWSDPLPVAEVRGIAEGSGRYSVGASDFPAFVSLEDLGKPEPPSFIMEGLPSGYVTSVFGHGGAGKSQVELMRAACIALGVSFYGLPVERRRVAYLSGEDRWETLHWRLQHICAHLGRKVADLAGHLFILDMVGRESILFGSGPQGSGYTATYAALAEFVTAQQIELLVIDGISDTFGGNENARGDVKRYVNSLLALVPPKRGAVIIVGHVDKNLARGNATTEGYSGSTAWHNSVRARWYLRSEGDADSRRLIFELQKSNLSAFGVQIGLSWDPQARILVGAPIAAAKPGELARLEREEREAIVAALRECAAKSHIVPSALTGPRTAFHVLSTAAAFPASLKTGKPARDRFWKHIEELRQRREVEVTAYKRPDGHKGEQLIATDGF